MAAQLDGEHAANDNFSIHCSIRAIKRIKIKEYQEQEMPEHEGDYKTLGLFGAAVVLTALVYALWRSL